MRSTVQILGRKYEELWKEKISEMFQFFSLHFSDFFSWRREGGLQKKLKQGVENIFEQGAKICKAGALMQEETYITLISVEEHPVRHFWF